LHNLQNYKAILTTSGDNLHDLLAEILDDFFGLNVDATDEGKEDIKILDDDAQKPIILLEVKGTNKGVKREHINQLDSHRERSDLSSDVLGVLLINNEMGVEGIDKRKETTVADQQIKHAQKQNVLIVRTVDFLLLMGLFESSSDRANALLKLFFQGPGWLKVEGDQPEIITL
jgi:hypothetical protein